MDLGAKRTDVYRRGTLLGFHGRKKGTCDSTTIYSNTDQEELLCRLREVYIEKAKMVYPRCKGDCGKEMAHVNFLYQKGKAIIKNHYSGL